MIQGKYLYSTDDLSELFNIQKKVLYSVEGYKEDSRQETLEKSVYAIAYANNIPVATGRLSFENQSYYIDKLAVLQEERRKGYGDFIVRMLVDKAFLLGGGDVNVYSPSNLIEFFKKIGFNIINGNQNNYIKLKICQQDLLKKCHIDK